MGQNEASARSTVLHSDRSTINAFWQQGMCCRGHIPHDPSVMAQQHTIHVHVNAVLLAPAR